MITRCWAHSNLSMNSSYSFCLYFICVAFVVVLVTMTVVLPVLHQQDLPQHQCCGNLDPSHVLHQEFSTGGDSALQGTCGTVWRQIWLSQLSGNRRRCSWWEGPGMLLNTLQCTEQPSLPWQRIIQPKTAAVLRLRNAGQHNKDNKFQRQEYHSNSQKIHHKFETLHKGNEGQSQK